MIDLANILMFSVSSLDVNIYWVYVLSRENYDLVVIGAGSAGCLAAHAAVKNGLTKIALIDRKKKDDKVKRDEQTYAIIGAAMEVHKTLGHGFLELVYQQAMALELKHQEIPFQREAELPVHYKTHRLDACYKADFICFDRIIVELKAIRALSGAEDAQVINYLKATGLTKALLFNFGAPKLEYKRLVFNLRKSV